MKYSELLLIHIENRAKNKPSQDEFIKPVIPLEKSEMPKLLESSQKPFILDTGNLDLKSVMDSIGISYNHKIKEVPMDHVLDYFQPEIARIYSQYKKRDTNFQLQGVFVVKNNGLILSFMTPHKMDIDIDLFGSMLTALKDFVKDTFPQDKKSHLTSLTRERQNFFIETDEDFYLVVVGEGTPPEGLANDMKVAMKRIKARYSRALKNFDGTISPFAKAWCEFFVPGPSQEPATRN